jgi:pimeloyl-ACP methyl ester carboxylesterase
LTTKLAFETFGQKNQPAIVFLHGGGSSSWSWHPVVALLQADYFCLVPDLPQHGGSAQVKPFSIERAADEITALIRSEVPARKAVIVGLSEGAQVGVSLLARAPDQVDSAILSGALLKPMASSRWFTPGILRWSYNWFLKPFMHSDWYIRWNMHASVGIPDQYYEKFKKDFQMTSQESWSNLMLANQSFRLPTDVNQFQGRLLALVGHKEYGVMKESARALASAVPHGQAGEVRLEGKFSLAQSHNWPLNATELCAKIIHAWVDAKPLPAEVLPFPAVPKNTSV